MAKRKKKSHKAYICLWMVLLCVLGSYYLFLAPRDGSFSQQENRMLSGWPEITAEEIKDGSFGQQIETYLLDQFPLRNQIISLTSFLESKLSLASHEDYLLIAEGPKDALDEGFDDSDLEELLSNMGSEEPEPPTQDTPTPEATEGSTPVETTEAAIPAGGENPPITEKEPMTIEDFPSAMGVYMDRGFGSERVQTYYRKYIAGVAAVLNKYAELLPENGKLMFTVVPQSNKASLYIKADQKQGYYADWDDMVNGLGANNVYALDTAEILSRPIENGEYVYYRMDMHWNTYGAYLVYSEMVKQAGLIPCSYEDDFDREIEEGFKGTYFRDLPSTYWGVEEDTLELLTPKWPMEIRQITGKDEYQVVDMYKLDAPASDRYTVYFGGPSSWKTLVSDNGMEENCLVITDSFGMVFLPYLTANYKNVHYYDPRYYKESTIGYTLAEMIEKENIQDIYVVVGDIHGFESGLLISDANRHLYGG